MTQQLRKLKGLLSKIARTAILSFIHNNNADYFSASYLENEFISNHEASTLLKDDEAKEYFKNYLHIIKKINNNNKSGLKKLLISHQSRYYDRIDLADIHYYALLQNKNKILKFLKYDIPSHNINQIFLLEVINNEILAFKDRDEKSLFSDAFDKYKRSFFSILLDEYFFNFAIGSPNLERAKEEIQVLSMKVKKIEII